MENNLSFNITTAYYIYMFCGAVDHTISVPVNCWVVWFIVSGRQQLIHAEFLTLNLVISELSHPVGYVCVVIQTFYSSVRMRTLVSFYIGTAVVARILFQCQICVDRYLAVVHPFLFIRYKKISYRGACLTAIWLLVISSGLSTLSAPFTSTGASVLPVAVLLPALCIELYCSVSIVWILRKTGPGNVQERSEGNKQKKRAIKIIIIALVMLIFNALPFIIVPWIDDNLPVADLYSIAFTLSSAGSSAQGFLFLSRSGKLPCKRMF